MSFQFTFERMQTESRQVHVVRLAAAVENRKDIAQSHDMLRRHALFRPPFVQRFEATVTE
jgi:hypothetical protein